MFESKAEIRQAKDSLWSALWAFDRGDLVPWHVVERITGPRHENPARGIIRYMLKRLLRERGLVTRCPAGEGIRMLTHKEVVELVFRHRNRKARKQQAACIRELECADTGSLSDHERRLLAMQLDRSNKQRRALSQSERLSSVIAHHESRPLRPVGI